MIITRSVHDLLLPSAALPHSPGPYIALVLVGFAIGTLGHLFKVRWLVGVGIALIVVGALLLPFAAGIPSERKEPARRKKPSEADSPNDADSTRPQGGAPTVEVPPFPTRRSEVP